MPMYLILLAILSLYKSQPGPHKWYKHWLQGSHLTRMAENAKSVAINSSTSKTSNIRCYAHLPLVLGDIRPFKEATWSTYLRCVGIWKDLVGNQADIARCFVHDHGGVTCRLDEIPIPEDGGYHRKCYNYFTDSSKQVRAVKKKQEEKASSLAGRQKFR